MARRSDTAHGWRTSARTDTGSPLAYTYTGTGRLASFADPQRDVEATYDYDAAGQRTASYVREGSLATTTTYTYEGLSLLALAAVRSDSTTASVAYLYDGAGRAYAGVYSATDVTATPFVLVSSDRGDVVSLADTDGATFAAYPYDAWGAVLETTVTATPAVSLALAKAIADTQPLRYAGYCYDGHSGLYYLSARSYDPTTRQFLTKDPARADGEESAYQYCGGDPVGGVDPSGLWQASFRPRPRSDEWNYFWEVLRVNSGYAYERMKAFGYSVWKTSAWFAGMVRTGGDWDFKASVASGWRGDKILRFGRQSLSYDDWGNVHFGFIAYWLGYTRQITIGGASAVGRMGGSSIQHEIKNSYWIGYGYDAASYNCRTRPKIYRAAAATSPNLYSRGWIPKWW